MGRIRPIPRPTPADLAWFARWGPSRYDPATGRILLVGDPPEYAREHELAHKAQHERPTFLYRLWSFWHDEPWHQNSPIARLLRLLLELDADLRARRALRARGLWNAENQKASHLVLRSYLCPRTLGKTKN